MKKHLSPTNILIALILIFQSYLMWKINQRDDFPMLEAAQRIVEKQDSILRQNEAVIESNERRIASHIDTVRFYEKQRTIINNNYAKDLSFILGANSGQQFDLYRRNTERFDSLFAAGFFINGR